MSTTTAPHSKETLAADAFLNAIHPHLAEPWAVLWLFRPDGPSCMHVTEGGVTEVVGHGYHAALLAHRLATRAVQDLPATLRESPPPPYLEGFRGDVEAHLELARRALDDIGQDGRTWLKTLRSAFVVMDRLVREWERLRSNLDDGRPDAA